MKSPARVDWVVVEKVDGVGFRWGYAGEDLIAEWTDILSLRATRSGELKSLQPMSGVSDDFVEKLRVGLVTAFLRAQRQQHCLHASAVALHGKAAVFIGASGLGKSTMAEHMCRRSGVELLADDMASIDIVAGAGVQVMPSESSMWLVTEGSSAKAPVKASRAAQGPARLSCVVALVFDDKAGALALRDLRGADALATLLPALVRFEKTRALWERESDFLGELVTHSRVVEARRSRDVSANAVADALHGMLAGGSK